MNHLFDQLAFAIVAESPGVLFSVRTGLFGLGTVVIDEVFLSVGSPYHLRALEADADSQVLLVRDGLGYAIFIIVVIGQIAREDDLLELRSRDSFSRLNSHE